MEKIIFRKFLYDFISFFLIVSLSLSLIVWIIQSVNYLDFISKDGHGFGVYFAFITSFSFNNKLGSVDRIFPTSGSVKTFAV